MESWLNEVLSKNNIDSLKNGLTPKQIESLVSKSNVVFNWLVYSICDVKRSTLNNRKRLIYLRDDWKKQLKLFKIDYEFLTNIDRPNDFDIHYIPFTRRAYKMTRDGKIYNCKTGSELKVNSSNRYKMVELNGRNRLYHQIVALTFIPNVNPFVNDVIDHYDQNKKNNDITNLRWTTQYINCHNKKNNHYATEEVIKRLIKVNNVYFDRTERVYYLDISMNQDGTKFTRL